MRGQDVTFILVHGGEVDGLECEVPLHSVHEGVKDPHVQPLRATQDHTQRTCQCSM